jgi:hypothetical protein
MAEIRDGALQCAYTPYERWYVTHLVTVPQGRHESMSGASYSSNDRTSSGSTRLLPLIGCHGVPGTVVQTWTYSRTRQLTQETVDLFCFEPSRSNSSKSLYIQSALTFALDRLYCLVPSTRGAKVLSVFPCRVQEFPTMLCWEQEQRFVDSIGR